MEYIHIRNLEKFHPGYRDRQLVWAKIYFSIVQGDPEFELIENEIDKWRFVAMICLELRAQKPLPNVDSYWQKQGFNIRKRPMSLTLKMLQGFLETVTNPLRTCESAVPQSREDKEKNREEKSMSTAQDFEKVWFSYPNRSGKKNALRHFLATVKTSDDVVRLEGALANYLKSGNVGKGFVKNGSTWFNEWEDWVEPTPEMMRGNNSDRLEIKDRQKCESCGEWFDKKVEHRCPKHPFRG